MEKTDPKHSFMRLLILASISVVIVILCNIIGSTNTFSAIIITILLFATAFTLLFFFVIVLGDLKNHIFDKEKKKFNYLYLSNAVFMTVVIVLFMMFYFQLLGGAFIELVF